MTSVSFAHETREMSDVREVRDKRLTQQIVEYQEMVVWNFFRLYHQTQKNEKSKKIMICVMKTHLKYFQRNVKQLTNPYTGESVYPEMTRKSKKMIQVIKKFLEHNESINSR